MSWLTSSLPGIATTIAGGVLDVIPGTQALGIPLTAAGLSMYGAEQQQIGSVNAAGQAQDFSAQQAQAQMAYQSKMSNTSYQRTVADMTAAGINPMMAINNGGASSPSGASGQAQMPQIQNSIGQGVASAVSMAALQNQMEGTSSQVGLNKAMGVKAMADANTAGMTASNLSLRNTALSSELSAIAAKAQNDKTQADISNKMAIPDAFSSRMGNYSNSAKSLMNLFNPLGKSMQQNSPRGTTLMDSNTGEILRETP